MIEDVKRWQHAFKNGDPGGMYQGFLAVTSHLETLYGQIGKLPQRFVDGVAPNGSARIPSPAQFAVSGLDGKFRVAIVNPQDALAQTPQILQAQMNAGLNRSLAPLVHNLQSALDLNFDQNSLVDYGVSAQLAYEVQDPNVTKFFRLRSSFDGQNWNDWQIYSSPVTCGPVGVYSGLLRSSANALLNSSATTANGTSPLSQSLTTTKILVAAAFINAGDQRISYLGGSVDPGAFGTFYVYAMDPMRAGGQVTFLATANFGDLASDNGISYFGYITTVAGGGGTGGGGFGCGIRGARVTMLDGSERPIELVRRGDFLRGCDGGSERVERVRMLLNQPCFRVTAADGSVLSGASDSHKMRRGDGGFAMMRDFIVGDIVRVRGVRQAIAAKEFIGMRTVFQIELSNSKTYFLDGFESHNLKPSRPIGG